MGRQSTWTPELTKDELLTVLLSAYGFELKEIAVAMHLSLRTVNVRLDNAKVKTGAKNTKHLVFLLSEKIKAFEEENYGIGGLADPAVVRKGNGHTV